MEGLFLAKVYGEEQRREILGCEAAKKQHIVPPQDVSAATALSHFGGMKYGKWTSTAVRLCFAV